MKRFTFIVLVMILWLTGCAAPGPISAPPESVDVGMPAPTLQNEPVATEAVVEAEGKLPATTFEAQTYINPEVGFAIDYPVGWTVTESVVGDRGSQTVFLSAPEIANLAELPKGATRVAVTVYQWDPKNDLSAFVDSRKVAWDASGFTIAEENELVLEQGLPARQFLVKTSDGLSVLYLFAVVNDQYVSVSGEGDMALVKEIALHLRPVLVK